MKLNFKVGKEYPYRSIAEAIEYLEAENVNLHGPDICGKGAIHFDYKNEDYWFVLTSSTVKEYYYKCVLIY